MKAIAVVAAGAISALGRGTSAFSVGEAGEEARSQIGVDQELEAYGLRRPLAARASLSEDDARADRAQALLCAAARGLVRELDEKVEGWRSRRIGLVIGTSGGGLPSLEAQLERRAGGRALDPALARSSFYFGPLAALKRELDIEPSECTLLLAACASSTVALGLGARRLESECVDLVIAGGFDALSLFIAAGFEALGATAGSRPQPFRSSRDGMALGEGAALCALVRGETAAPPLGYLLGFGTSCDGVHVTAPDRTGAGLSRAASLALADAGLAPSEIDLVSAHATSTPFNDAAEANAIALALGSAAERTVVHPYKAVIGHTLGAAGALESLAALSALHAELLPAAVGSGPIEVNLSARLLEHNTPAHPGFCLKLSSAFGGANAALVLGTRPVRAARARQRRTVYLRAVGRPRLELDAKRVSERFGIDELKLGRLDPVSALAVAACESALEALDTKLPSDAGIIVGTAAATLDVNEIFHARLRERGPRAAEPRRFPATSPNLAAGECSIVFGLKGPSFAVGASPAAALEALLVAFDLLEAGDTSALLVAAVEQVGPVAAETFAAAGYETPSLGAVALVLEAAEAPDPSGIQRARLTELHRQALAAGGPLGGAAAGWPSLLEAAQLLTVG